MEITNGDVQQMRRGAPAEPRGPKVRLYDRPAAPSWSERWETYARDQSGEPFSRGDGDCCALVAGWVNTVLDDPLALVLPSLTEDAAKRYLAAGGGLEELAHDRLRPLGYRAVTDAVHYQFGVIVFSVDDNPDFPVGVGVVVGTRIATRTDRRRGITYIAPFRVGVLTVYNHPRIVSAWV